MRGYPEWVRVGGILCLALCLAGCTEVQAVQDWISPPTPQQIDARLREQASGGHPAEALSAAEDYLVRHPADAHELHRSMARLYLAQGNAEAAVRHLTLASGGNDAPAPRSAPPETITPPSADQRAPSAPPPAGFGTAVDGASAQVLPDGSISVRAGSGAASAGNLAR